MTINKIKVIGNTHTQTETILAFVPELKEKSEYNEEELTNIIKRGKERLDITGWFYSTEIYITPSQEGTNFRNIVIEVADGFLIRPGGGAIYGVYGMDNIYGNGEFYSVDLGWNAQYIDFGSYFVNKDVFFKIGLGNMPSGFYTNTETNAYNWNSIQNIGSYQEIGCRFNYDFSLSLSNTVNYIFSDNYSCIGGYDSISVAALLDARPDIYSSSHGYFAGITYSYIFPFESCLYPFNRFKFEADKYISIIPGYDNLTLALKLDGQFQDNETQIYYPDYLKLSLAGIDGIRSLNDPDLIGNILLDGHAELRWDFFQTAFFGIFNMDFEILSFFDTGEAAEGAEYFTRDKIQYAYGAGLRIFFREPIYIPLRFEFGWDKLGDMSFFFSMSAPF